MARGAGDGGLRASEAGLIRQTPTSPRGPFPPDIPVLMRPPSGYTFFGPRKVIFTALTPQFVFQMYRLEQKTLAGKWSHREPEQEVKPGPPLTPLLLLGYMT